MMQCEANVANCPIFRLMTDKEREDTLSLSQTLQLKSGRSVLVEGDNHPHGLWMIRSGKCEVVHSSPKVGEQQVNFLGSGTIFGEVSFFDPQPHSATIRVVESAEILHFPAGALPQLHELNGSAAHQLLINLGRLMAQKIRHIDKRLMAEMVVTAMSYHPKTV